MTQTGDFCLMAWHLLFGVECVSSYLPRLNLLAATKSSTAPKSSYVELELAAADKKQHTGRDAREGCVGPGLSAHCPLEALSKQKQA
ncbi:uncharacterized protein B0I36DRAFT_320859 [Microdochium trichocladiopsis]|uniref:Secreted protein n=1 Tax=Microdochium trichocladiopsis TaxID=1682393 RepID=A0A9P8Y9N2_9PEZI|nr:uncharacterized protein B0I36DRAFT_320859 [Microdochium trichocladiopsis]KAH7033136.1 hypothetical protein B0I36DRAFT_320859 [Microdochium trichocladiopsis]